ncbi:MAG: hypothetical protein IH917_15055 [Acidobacteria bacterium]|nr:hypothetical protein [Acidobacteriota bacterium]
MREIVGLLDNLMETQGPKGKPNAGGILIDRVHQRQENIQGLAPRFVILLSKKRLESVLFLNSVHNLYLIVSFHKYGDVCGERDGVEFAKRRRRDVNDIVEEERQRNRRRPAATLRADGGCGRSLCLSSSPMFLHRLLLVP